jgi:murein DD-endopeptidase MepM/ murein hydrolase activator NlpD
MAKLTYCFNPNTLHYEKVRIPSKGKFYRIVTWFLIFSVIVVAIIMGLHFFWFPVVSNLQEENEHLLAQYTIMDKELNNLEGVLNDIQQRDDNLYRVIFEADPIPSSIRQSGFGGANRYKHLESMDNAEIVIHTKQRLDMLTKKVYIQSKSYDEVLQLALNKKEMLASIPAIMPISNKDLKRTASGWGYRIHPIYKIRKFHYGQDFSAPTGTKIYATGDGVVKLVKSSRVGFGRHILIGHGFGYRTIYAHMSKFNVKKGQRVKRGDVIGYVGNTGTSTAPHLHYEVHHNRKPVNPGFYYFNDLSPEEYERMLLISSNSGQTFD